jgi:hypothetical protein
MLNRSPSEACGVHFNLSRQGERGRGSGHVRRCLAFWRRQHILTDLAFWPEEGKRVKEHIRAGSFCFEKRPTGGRAMNIRLPTFGVFQKWMSDEGRRLGK